MPANSAPLGPANTSMGLQHPHREVQLSPDFASSCFCHPECDVSRISHTELVPDSHRHYLQVASSEFQVQSKSFLKLCTAASRSPSHSMDSSPGLGLVLLSGTAAQLPFSHTISHRSTPSEWKSPSSNPKLTPLQLKRFYGTVEKWGDTSRKLLLAQSKVQNLSRGAELVQPERQECCQAFPNWSNHQCLGLLGGFKHRSAGKAITGVLLTHQVSPFAMGLKTINGHLCVRFIAQI